MKTIKVEIAIPDWAKWIATDEDGTVCAFDSDPSPGKRIWGSNDGRHIILSVHGIPPEDFTKTLQKVEK